MLNDQKFIGFFLPEQPYGFMSNWYPSEFTYAGKTYAHVEQYMMVQKVMVFGQQKLAEMIMETDDPAVCKKLGGTHFPEFDTDLWAKIAKQVVKRGVRAKYVCNPELLDKLIDTKDVLLAECSPRDKRWGIGIGPDDASRFDVSKWQGDNWMGQITMEVREELRKIKSVFGSAAFLSECLENATVPHWEMTAGELKRYPWLYPVIHAYAETVKGYIARDYFYNGKTLLDWENVIQSSPNLGVPETGFYELKQDVYETVIIQGCL